MFDSIGPNTSECQGSCCLMSETGDTGGCHRTPCSPSWIATSCCPVSQQMLTATMKKTQAHSPNVLSKNASQQASRARGTEQGPGSKSGDYQMWISSVQLLNCVWLFMTPWPAAHQASVPIISSHSLLKLMSIESVMTSNHLNLCWPLLLLPSIFPSIRVFSKQSVLRIRWPKYWSFSFSISPSNEHSGLISFRLDWLDLLAIQGTLKSLLKHHSLNHQFFCTQISLYSNFHIHSWLLEKP